MKAAKFELVMVCIYFITLVIIGQSFAQIDPATVAGAWLFDEDGGDVANDLSPNGNDGTLTKNPKWVEGKFGSALEFDGTNGVEIANPDQFEFLNWTYVLWFRAAAGGDYPNLIGRQFANSHGWTIHLDPAGVTFRIRIDTDGGINQVRTVPKPVRDEEWHHGAIVHNDDDKTLQMYIDGVMGAQNYSGDYQNSGGFLKIASPAVGAVNLNQGAIDDVAIFDELLEEDDILDIMNLGVAEATGLAPVSASDKLATTWASIKSY